MSIELAPPKPLTGTKITIIIVVAVVIFLGSIIMLVYGSTLPNQTSQEKTINGALLGIGSILLISSVILPIVYFVASSPASTGLPVQAAQYQYRGLG